jgi:glycosyltransferase involved in cell wall biosynthesis
MKALLLSAYDARSHQLWRHNIKTMFPDIEWCELTLPPRYFSWRVRGNSLTWAFNHRAVLTDNYDFILSTSMTDLSALRGFIPSLGAIPTAIYFHENQFAYPDNPATSGSAMNAVEPQILSLYTALCADEVVFNSAFNKKSFINGAKALLQKLPDHVPKGLIDTLQRARVIPVPLTQALFSHKQESTTMKSEPLTIVWNHRWEYDKGPALLLAIVSSLVSKGTHFRLHVLGQRFRQTPAEFDEIGRILSSYYHSSGITPGRWGFIDDQAEYDATLSGADVVLSTATHDFQGLAILEATALGCTPLAPHCMAYPEYLPEQCLYSLDTTIGTSASRAVERLSQWAHDKHTGKTLPYVDVASFSPPALRGAYSTLFDSLCSKA